MNLNALHRRLMQDVLEITGLRRWAQAWSNDILRRANVETYEEDDEPF